MFNLKTITQSMTSYLNNSLPHVLIAGLIQRQEQKCQTQQSDETAHQQLSVPSGTQLDNRTYSRLTSQETWPWCKELCLQVFYHQWLFDNASIIHQKQLRQVTMRLCTDVKNNALHMFNIQAVSAHCPGSPFLQAQPLASPSPNLPQGCQWHEPM